MENYEDTLEEGIDNKDLLLELEEIFKYMAELEKNIIKGNFQDGYYEISIIINKLKKLKFNLKET